MWVTTFLWNPVLVCEFLKSHKFIAFMATILYLVLLLWLVTWYSSFINVFMLYMQESLIDGADDDESGFLKLKPTQEWIGWESDSAPMNKKALAKVGHLFMNVLVLCIHSFTRPSHCKTLLRLSYFLDCRHYEMTAREGRSLTFWNMKLYDYSFQYVFLISLPVRSLWFNKTLYYAKWLFSMYQ